MPRILILLALFLVGCAAPNSKIPQSSSSEMDEERIQQTAIALRYESDYRNRASAVLMKIAAANVDVCTGVTTYSAGFSPAYIPEMTSADGRIMAAAYSFGPGLTVNVVNSPALEAGLKHGDQITSINGHPIKLGMTQNAFAFEYLKPISGEGASAPIVLGIIRNGTEVQTITVTPRKICGYYDAQVQNSTEVNAFANGDNITVTRGMLDFIKSDDELALILGHEMAHNINQHIQKQSGNKRVGQLFGVLVTLITGTNAIDAGGELGRQMFSQDFEAEADYVGTYLAARAGYDVQSAGQLWRRFAALHPKAIHTTPFDTHPDTAKRFLLIQQAANEIAEKKAKGEPLLPNVKLEAAARPL